MRSLRSIVAVAAGAAAVIILWGALSGHVDDAVSARFVPHFDAATRPPLSNPLEWSLAWDLFIGLLLLAGGFLTALLASHRRLHHALVLAILVDGLGIVTLHVQLTGELVAYGSDMGPALVNIAREVAVTVAGAAIGGLLAVRLMAHRAGVRSGP